MKNMTMSNTTMGSHNMTGHDMSMDHGSMDHTSGHTNIFHFSVEAVILFAGWKTVTWTGKYTHLHTDSVVKLGYNVKQEAVLGFWT